MSLRVLLASLCFTAVALAGCSDGAPKPPAEAEPEFGVEPTDTTGIIRGVLVDSAVRPVAGVQVAAQSGAVAKQAISSADGLFAFEGLEPGTWFLTASKPGFFQARASTEVAAGVAEPPIVKIQLLEDVENRPYYEAYVWHGFIECSVGIPEVGSVNPCFATPTSSNVWEMNLTGSPAFVQAEMLWEPTTAVGSSFWLSSFVAGSDPLEPDDYAEAMGTSPLLLPIAGDLLQEKDVGDPEPLAFRVFPGIDQPTAFVSQAFDVYIHVFYGYTPPEGWQFSVEGQVPGAN
jgi:hypothetical protein